MSTVNKVVIFILCFISGICAYSEWCNVNGYLTYCSDGCCTRSYDDDYCCLTGDTGRIVGIVVGCIVGVGAIITVLVVIFCCCRKGRGASGRVMNPLTTTTMTSTTVGQPGVPMAAPVYPGTYPAGQVGPNIGYNQPYAPQPVPGTQPAGFNQPYALQSVQGIQNAGYSQPVPQRAEEGFQNAGFVPSYPQPSAPEGGPDVGKPPPYSELE